jgi:hypothetical protein
MPHSMWTRQFCLPERFKSVPLSEAQLNANRANAQASTGPRTEEGKQRSRLNALRHGITAKVIVMTEEEMEAYQTFSNGLLAEWQPQGATEKILVQALADTHWRLNCGRTHELALFAFSTMMNLPPRSRPNAPRSTPPSLRCACFLARPTRLAGRLHQPCPITKSDEYHKRNSRRRHCLSTPKIRAFRRVTRCSSRLRQQTNPQVFSLQQKMASFLRINKSSIGQRPRAVKSAPPPLLF